MTATRATRRTAPVALMLVGASMLVMAPAAVADPELPVGLGTAGTFAILAATGITNTGPTTITGDVGSFPTPSETGFEDVTIIGTNHPVADTVTEGAKVDLDAAYADAAGRTPATPHGVELGGSTLLPGIYTGGTFGLTGTLILDAAGKPDAMFIFQAASTVIAETYSQVLLINGANSCNVVWQVGSSAVFKVGSHFVGDVLAHTSITAQTNTVFQGRLLARGGAVTMDTVTISNACIQADVTTTTTAAPTTTTTSGPTTTTTVAPTTTTVAVLPPLPTVPLAPTAGPTPPLVGTPLIPTATPSRGPGSPPRPPTLFVTPPANPLAPPSPPAPPRLPMTGMELLGSLGAGLAVTVLGAILLVVERDRRDGCACRWRS